MENVPPNWNPYGGMLAALVFIGLLIVAVLVVQLARWALKRIAREAQPMDRPCA